MITGSAGSTTFTSCRSSSPSASPGGDRGGRDAGGAPSGHRAPPPPRSLPRTRGRVRRGSARARGRGSPRRRRSGWSTWEGDLDGRALAGTARDRDRSVVGGDDLLRPREPEPAARPLAGGAEREELRQTLGRDDGPRVLDPAAGAPAVARSVGRPGPQGG